MSGNGPRDEGRNGSEIAIIAMACRFPGASTPEEFWRHLRDGVESLVELTDDALRAAGVPEEQIADPSYVRRASVIDGIEDFDAGFFGYAPLEATIMDPQHRLFLECSWEAFERAGYDPRAYPGSVGVFTGAKTNTYLFNAVAQRHLYPTLDNFQIALGNDLAAMATRVSYKLDLRGPSYALHTACSTALVAVHLACQSLLLDECSMALAGGAAINVPQRRGYPYQKGGILSPDGSCRTFDAAAAGSNFGNGVGAVLLKRLDDALADGDPIHAVIRGSAANNDGAAKASFTAPGVEGQIAVLLEAMAVAGVEAEEISYIEAHGTATDLGDSIEMLALTEAFRASTEGRGFCAIGSAKTNIGHLETAAGIAGLIKVAAALEAAELPPSLHFETPNPKIDFAASPFAVNTELRPWPSPPDGGRRLAGLSSFGIGSTNVHAILEEPPPPLPTDPGRRWQALILSARSAAALETLGRNLGAHLEAHPELDLADVAYTLGVGRQAFEHRRTLVCQDRAAAVAALPAAGGDRRGHVQRVGRQVAFLLPGLGEHHLDMGLGLYQREAVFRETVDRAAAVLTPLLGSDLREVIYPRGVDAEEEVGGGLDLAALLGRGGRRPGGDALAAGARLDRTLFAQPAIFVVELALARLFMAHGVEPRAVIGYSIGEYVCACLAGVLDTDDALALVARRARLIDALPPGAMLAATLGEAELLPCLERHGLALAAVNGTTGCVAAGPEEAVAALEAELAGSGVVHRRLRTTHAFHSPMLASASDELTALARTFTLHPPTLPWISTLTGERITDEEAVDPTYWARHMCGPVRFHEGVGRLLDEDRALLEVGPGQSLTSFSRLHPGCGPERPVISAMRSRHDAAGDAAAWLSALGDLWLAGAAVDWAACWAGERRRRVVLPTYPFERSRYWIEPDAETLARTDGREVPAPAAAGDAGPVKIPDLERWLYRRRWEKHPWPETTDSPGERSGPPTRCLVLADELGLAAAMVRELTDVETVIVVPGEAFGRDEDGRYRVRPGRAEDWQALLGELATGPPLTRGLHLWNVGPAASGDEAAFRAAQELGFYSLIAFVQAWSRQGRGGRLELDVVTTGVQDVTGEETLIPERSTVLGALAVIPQEHPNILTRAIDIDLPTAPDAGDGAVDVAQVARRLAAELRSADAEPVVVHRGGERRVREFAPLEMPPADTARPFRDGGVYLITGGLGGIGLVIAEHVARQQGAKLVLTRRSPLPPRDTWSRWARDGDPANAEVDARTRAAVARVQALEAAGAEVMALAADVADEAAMRGVVASACERFGTIHGVIHAAGVLAPDSFETVATAGRDACERHFGPKVYGLYVLERVLSGIELDFCTVYSSLSAILGGLGYAGYATANLFMDFFTTRHNRQAASTAWQSIDWDSWHYEEDEAARGGLGTTLSELAMSPSEGVETLRRLLTLEHPRHLVISTGELAPRIEQWVTLRALRGAAQAGTSGSGNVTQLVAGEGLEHRIAGVWTRVLGVEAGYEENFFDVGGNSLLAMQLVGELRQDLGVEVEPVALFEAPTIRAMAEHLAPDPDTSAAAPAPSPAASPAPRRAAGESFEVAVIGLSGRFPGANSVDAFWDNLCAGRESISFFSDDELLAAGVDPVLLADPTYVKARPILDDIEHFDAGLFGYSPREAEVMDPQHRLFLECAWEAFENAGYDTRRYDGRVGVYAGASISSYMQGVYTHPEILQSVDTFQILLGNEKDSLTTKVSYKLSLRGPSLAIQTFCSTSLVAVHMACQALRNGEADMALAGGVSIIIPQVSGYRFQEGGINSRDGHVRAFDAKATGMVFGNGAGLVVLKPLNDALRDGDRIDAVIKGTAINNDGSLKAGYTAASIEGQSQVVVDALAASGVDPATITYVEAHGSGTGLGDPVELAALTRAFRRSTDGRRFCAVGSVKTNVGHLDRAAGVTGLIKTVLSLKHGQLPPSLHFEEPNPEIDFDSGPFYVNSELRDWPAPEAAPRRAGVTSLGIGGTNAHAVLEEAPAVPPGDTAPDLQLLVLSAHTPGALETAARNLADALELEASRGTPLADVAFTLQVGRRELSHRRAVVCRDLEEAARLWREGEGVRTPDLVPEEGRRQVVFLFPGQGSQYPGMGRELYDREPVYRREIDRCADLLQPELGLDLRSLLHAVTEDAEDAEEAGRRLAETRVTQPALFTVEWALAQLWRSWGFEPRALIGHSVGEYVAACLAGVFTLEDALRVVAERSRRIQEMPSGEMLAIPVGEEEIGPRLGDDLDLAAINAPDRVVVSGEAAAIARLAEVLAAEGIDARRLHTSHAFHSRLLEPAVEPFVAFVAGVERRAPRIPFLSCRTGTWITPEEAVDAAYWGAQLRGAVRFSDGVREVLADGASVLLEVGPGTTLTTLGQRHLEPGHNRSLIASLPAPRQARPADEAVLEALGRLWLARLSPDWTAVHGGARRRRLALPTYPFERQRHWVQWTGEVSPAGSAAGRRPEEWLHVPAWKTSSRPRPAENVAAEAGPWLLLSDGGPLAEALEHRLRSLGPPISVAAPGVDLGGLLGSLDDPPAVVLDTRALAARNGSEPIESFLRTARDLDRQAREQTAVWVLSEDVHDVLGQETPVRSLAPLPAVCRAVTRGTAHLQCRHLDLTRASDAAHLEQAVEQILAEVAAEPPESTLAYRGRRRWIPTIEPAGNLPAKEDPAGDGSPEPSLPVGTWIFTGGLDQPGFHLVEALSERSGQRFAFLEPEALPPRDTWDELLEPRLPEPEEIEACRASLAADMGIELDFEGLALPARMERLAGEVERLEIPDDFDSMSDSLCAAYSYLYFAQDLDVEPGRAWSYGELREALGIQPRFERFFQYLLHVLDRAGMATLDGDQVTFHEVSADRVDPETLGRRIKERYPDFRPGIDCVAHCAAHYPEVFRGRTDPVSVLFPGGNSEMLRSVMETQDRYSVNRVFYPLMAEVIREAAAGLEHRPLRVLEIGAGDGNLTWDLAEALRDSNVEYHFTDIGRSFVVAGQKTAAERGLDGLLRFGVLDITKDPREQGFERFSFDVVVAFDVVHATPDVRATLLNLRRLMSPGGWTMILEPTRDQHWISLIWGLAEGWWLFEDDLRSLHPLLAPARWQEVLSELGFSSCNVFPTSAEERARVDHSLLMVRQPANPDLPEFLETAVERWQQRRRETAARIRKLRHLEERGAEVVWSEAPSPEAIPAAVRNVQERWGPLHGVLHAAGPWSPAAPAPVDDLDPSVYRRSSHASDAVIDALEAGLAGTDLELALLVSPLSAAGDSATGPENVVQLEHAARAVRAEGASPAWRSLEWGVPLGGSHGDGHQEAGLSPRLGACALAAALERPLGPRVLVSHRPDPAMASAWNRLPAPRPKLDDLAASVGGDYVAPGTQEEIGVAAIWQQVLGLDRVGLQDNFFELGGDSLIATQIHSRLVETFAIELPVEAIFTLATVAEQAAEVARLRAADEQRDQEEILSLLADMSDEEAEKVLLELS